MQIESRWLGQVEYQQGVELQDSEKIRLKEQKRGTIFGLEHLDVITLGKRGDLQADLNASPAEIAAQEVALHQSARGGQATLHARGQLVIYPILPLRDFGIGARKYVETLEAATLAFLAELGVSAHRGADEPGLYTSSGKLVFFGIQISQGFSSHGIAINVANDLRLFSLIRSCGKTAEKFDSLRLKGATAQLQELFFLWVQHFQKTLNLTHRAGCD